MTSDTLRNPVIAMIGAGAVGGYYGSRLAQHGFDVHFLLRSDYAAVRQNGLKIKSCDGDFVLPPQTLHVYDDPRKMPAADLVIVTLKSTANDQFDSLIRPLLKDDSILLTLQNGLGNEQMLADLFGPQRVLGGIAFVCINRLEPGVIHHTTHGLIRIGEFINPTPRGETGPQGQTDGAPTPRLLRLAEIFKSSQIQCELLPHLRRGRWEKLLWNIPFNGLSAALDQTTDRILASAQGVELVRRIMREVIATAAADGAVLAPELIERQIANTREMGAYRTSSHIDRLENRPLEIEALIGRPLRAAQEKGVRTPRMEMLYHQLCVIDGRGGK